MAVTFNQRPLINLLCVLTCCLASAALPALAETHRVLLIPFHYNETSVTISKSDGSSVELNFNVPPRRTASEWQTFFDTSMMGAYVKEVSYGKKTLSLTVLMNPAMSAGWFLAPHSVAEYFDTKNAKYGIHKPLDDIVNLAASSGADLSKFDAFVAFGNASTSGAQTQSSFGKTGRPVVLFNEIKSDNAVVATLLHEVVHTMLPGVNIDLYGDGAKLADQSWPSSCGGTAGCQGSSATVSTDNYSDWDLMANHNALTHPSLITKNKMGWIESNVLYKSPILPSTLPYSDQIPLSALSAPNGAPLGIELTYSDKNAPVAGYYVECRRKIGYDAGIPKEGVLVTELGKGKCGRLARVISGSPTSLNSVCRAPLSTTTPNQEKIVDTARGLIISGATYGADRCLVNITFTSNKVPDLSFSYPKYSKVGNSDIWGSTDIWIDTVANGINTYPPQQALDATGAPSGQGDFPIVGLPAKVVYRIRNKGNADAHNVRVEVSISQSSKVAIDPGVCSTGTNGVQLDDPPEVLSVSEIDVLAAGEETIQSLDWFPKLATPAQISARVISFDEFVLDPNKINDQTRETVIISHAGEPADANPQKGEASILITNPCLKDRLTVRLAHPNPLFSKPTPDPYPEPYFEGGPLAADSSWRLTFDSTSALLEPGAEAQFNYRVTARLRGARGFFAFPVSVNLTQYFDWPVDPSSFEPRSVIMKLPPQVGGILEASAMTCSLSSGRVLDSVRVRGQLRPSKANESIILKIVPRTLPRLRSRSAFQEIRTGTSGEFVFNLPSGAESASITAIWPGDLRNAGASTHCARPN